MRDATEVLDLTLDLPIRGKTYRVEPPTAAVGAALMNRLAAGVAVDAGLTLSDEDRAQATVGGDDEDEFARMCLGSAFDEMVVDDLPKPLLDFAVSTAFIAWTMGKDAAVAWWESGGKVPGAGKRPSGLPRMETQTPRAAATTTPKRASRSGTSAKKKAKRREA